MLNRLLALDAFLARDLVRPFQWIANAFVLLLTMVGLMVGLALMGQSVVIGLFVILLTVSLGGALFLGVRLAAESVIAIARMHERFVGGGPNDPIPPP
jgi:hypothetical protein